MLKQINKKLNRLSAMASVSVLGGLLTSTDSYAAKSWNNISSKLTSQIANLPGLFTAMAYIFGILLAILGLIKIKDHVENPSQTPLKEGAIKLTIAGALMLIPVFAGVAQSALNAGGDVDAGATKLQKISTFNAVN